MIEKKFTINASEKNMGVNKKPINPTHDNPAMITFFDFTKIISVKL